MKFLLAIGIATAVFGSLLYGGLAETMDHHHQHQDTEAEHGNNRYKRWSWWDVSGPPYRAFDHEPFATPPSLLFAMPRPGPVLRVPIEGTKAGFSQFVRDRVARGSGIPSGTTDLTRPQIWNNLKELGKKLAGSNQKPFNPNRWMPTRRWN
ncbi:hypothetical protein BV898_04532 [Hypsibius exemplaris]|uniref:Uncharacterized protein n=1 Tax=Hypsibius exemplaris TaxID=2072580 RepID=A0A1W0X2C3_HYPEX|nr:hypothetical protein BV898_04532 [Hypsibius exemplaris]